MTDLTWYAAKLVQLSAPSISSGPHEREGDRKASISAARVAFDGAFLHIQPDSEGAPVTVVPSTSLHRLTYDPAR
ncbi:hypothetical protein [Streptomyces sp. NPDC002564]|uniref:hypothetical protein n=1 Tax=Streptomyces sp. NPDC002564 TaxID=3364649 RepID=UPI0036BC130E